MSLIARTESIPFYLFGSYVRQNVGNRITRLNAGKDFRSPLATVYDETSRPPSGEGGYMIENRR